MLTLLGPEVDVVVVDGFGGVNQGNDEFLFFDDALLSHPIIGKQSCRGLLLLLLMLDLELLAALLRLVLILDFNGS